MTSVLTSRLRIGVASSIHNACEIVSSQLQTRSHEPHSCLKQYDIQVLNVNEIESNDLHDISILLADPAQIVKYRPSLPSLQWCQSTFAGVDVLLRAARTNVLETDFVLTRMGGVFGQIMAEYVLGWLIAYERKFTMSHLKQKEKIWAQTSLNRYRRLSDLTIGVLGAGDVGSAVLDTACVGFHMKGIGLHRDMDALRQKTDIQKLPYHATDSLEYLLQNSDVVVNLLPSTPKTWGLLNDKMLTMCKPNTIFMNAGRGDIISEESILEALDSGAIAHCVLDVFAKEPLPETSALWSHPNVTVTPHVAASSLPNDVVTVFANNLERFLNTKELKYKLNWNNQY